MTAIIPFLFILICPLMMWFMMRGMHGRDSHAADEQRDELEARVEDLENELRRLQRPRVDAAGDAQESRVLTPM